MEIPRRASGVKRPTTPGVSPGTPPSAAAVPSVASPHGHRRRPTTPDELSDKPPATPPSPVRNTCPSPAQRANSYGTPWLLGYRQLRPGRSQRRDGSDQTMTETASGKGSRPSPGASETTAAASVAMPTYAFMAWYHGAPGPYHRNFSGRSFIMRHKETIRLGGGRRQA